jgi:hypothetical protein
MNIAHTIRTGALCLSVLLASSQLGRSGQSQPPEKEQAGSQAGSSGKSSEQMGSRGSKESPLQKCDSDTTKTDTTKTAKKKKSKKPVPTKPS